MAETAKIEPLSEVPVEAPAGQPERARGRPPGRHLLSRDRLLQAAHTLCARGDFMMASVDEIARQAGCSRAAFYLHFKSKEEMLHTVLSQNRDLWLQNYKTIQPDVLTSRTALLTWLKRFITNFQASGEIMALTILAVPAADAHKTFHQRRCMAAEILGHRVPELRVFREDGSIDEAKQWDIILFAYQVEQTAQALYFGRDYLNQDLALDRLCKQFLSLID